MERLLRLWDELDELLVYGRYFAASIWHGGRVAALKPGRYAPISGGGIPATRPGEADARD